MPATGDTGLVEISGAIKASPDLVLELWSWSVSILPLNLRERKTGASDCNHTGLSQ